MNFGTAKNGYDTSMIYNFYEEYFIPYKGTHDNTSRNKTITRGDFARIYAAFKGYDLMGSIGTPIIAVESGTVEHLGWNQYGGWRIGIRSFDRKRFGGMNFGWAIR